MIDTLALAERLEREYGDDPERARRHARILGDMVEGGEVATRRDIQDLRTDMQHEIGALRSDMQHEIGTLRAEMQNEIGALRADMQHMDTSLRSEMREIEQRLRGELYGEIAKLAWRMAGMLIAQTAVLLALLRFLPA